MNVNMMLEQVLARKDVAIVGGGFAESVTLSFGDESHVVRGNPDSASLVVVANAYRAVRSDGTTDLYLIRTLVPLSYQKVEIGRTYNPKVEKGGREREVVPQVESFPSVIHSTKLARMELARRLVQDGVFDEEPELLPTLLVVELGKGVIGDAEWTDDKCLKTLVGIRSGNMSSATLNQDGRMSVKVHAEIGDIAAFSAEAVVAMEAYAGRMSVMHGSDWEERTGNSYFRKSLHGNILYSLPAFLLNELRGDPRQKVAGVAPIMRLKKMDQEYMGGYSLRLQCNGMKGLPVIVALGAMLGPSDMPMVDITDSYEAYGERHMTGREMAEAFSSLIHSNEEAENLMAFAMQESLECGASLVARACLSALIGSDHGRRAIASGKSGRDAAVNLLVASALATEYGVDAWGDWLAGEVASIVGLVRYANVVELMVPDACEALELDDVLGILASDGSGISPDWHTMAETSRRVYGERQRSLADGSGRHDVYGEDWDDWDEWEELEPCLYSMSGPDTTTYPADLFMGTCELINACRHAFRHLDGMGWRQLLRAYPLLAAILDENGHARPIHNDTVAAAYGAFRLLADECGFDDDGNPRCVRLPGVVMDDGSILSVRIEPGMGGDGVIGRIATDESGDGDDDPSGRDLVLIPADGMSFDSADDVMEFVFSICIATDDEDMANS